MFDSGVGLALRNVHTFGKEFEMVNQVFHTCFHFGTFGRSKFVVCGNDRTRIDTQPLGTLFDDAHGLTHFFHTAEVTVVAVAVDADWDVEIHFVVHFVRLCLTHVPFHAGTAQHHAGKTFLHGALRSDNADADGTLFPNTVVGQEGFECIDVFRETFAEGVDKVEHGAFTGFVELLQYFGVAEFAALVFRHEVGQVAVNAAGTEVGCVHTRAGNGFVQVHQLFAVAEGVKDGGHRADVEGVRTDAHQVIEDARYFGKHHANILGADRHIDTGKFFYCQTIRLLIDHHGNVVQAVHIGQGLQIGFGFSQFFSTAVKEADMRVGADDGFALQLQNHTQYAVRRRVLRAEVDGVVS